MKIAVTLIALTLCGCTTVGNFVTNHPVATAVGVAIVAGSIAASANHHSHADSPTRIPRQSPCQPQGLTPC